MNFEITFPLSPCEENLNRSHIFICGTANYKLSHQLVIGRYYRCIEKLPYLYPRFFTGEVHISIQNILSPSMTMRFFSVFFVRLTIQMWATGWSIHVPFIQSNVNLSDKHCIATIHRRQLPYFLLSKPCFTIYHWVLSNFCGLVQFRKYLIPNSIILSSVSVLLRFQD